MRAFITGGTGSLGQALLRNVGDLGFSEVTVYSRDEVKQSELKRRYPNIRYMLGDIRDYDRLLMAMRGHDVVIHTAAYKQVPSAEANVDEAIATNVMGSLNVARAAVWNNVKTVVGVSTDKACQPVNAYGETKALMEKLFQQADTWGATIFTCVRYGNVLGSRGSVVPLFRSQAKSGHYTVTDLNMTRFWMTLDDAVKMIRVAYDDEAPVEDGVVLVAPCKASSMMALVEAVDKLWGGYNPIKLVFIGTRAGEKTHEQLIHLSESLQTVEPDDDMPYYQIVPPNSAEIDDATIPFEYRSDTAPQLSIDELVAMLEKCDA